MGRRHKPNRKKLLKEALRAQNRKESAELVDDGPLRHIHPKRELVESEATSHAKPTLLKWTPLLIAVIGTLSFATGLRGKFMPDDTSQIANNPIAHSISNIGRLFTGSTYFNGTTLVGNYYRPLMESTFSAIYTFFGANPMPFHILQLAVYIAAAILVFQFFRYRFNSSLALGLALIFLVHPMNSQVVFSISALQDTLYFFFGMLAIWLLLRSNSYINTVLSVVSIFFSLLSKENGALFIVVALVYLYISDRDRMRQYAKLLALPIVLYLILRFNAIGLGVHSQQATIDNMSLWGRLIMIPSIIWFYFRTFIWPTRLSSGYYWTNSHLTLHNFWLPIVIDTVIITALVYGANLVRRMQSQGDYVAYCFFAAWAAIGMVGLLQIVPLDMTACTNWFIFSMIGVLGMIGEVIKAIPWKLPTWRSLGIAAVAVIVVLGIGSFLRGFDWRDPQALYLRDAADAPMNNAVAYENLSNTSFNKGDYVHEAEYADKAIAILPGYTDYNNLGYADLKLGDYPGALNAFQQGLKYYPVENLYAGIAVVSMYYNFPSNQQLLTDGIKAYPHDPTLWSALAILQIHQHDQKDAVATISLASKYTQIDSNIYNAIMNHKSFTIDYGAQPELIQ